MATSSSYLLPVLRELSELNDNRLTLASGQGAFIQSRTMGKRDRTDSDKKAKKRSKKESEKAPDGKTESTKSRNVGSNNPPDQSKAPKTRKTKKAIFLKKKVDVELSLLPSSLHNTEDAVQDSLNQMLLKFSDGLGGILLACENVQIKSDGKGQGRGWILNELPWIHYTVSCDALVFRPYVECEVRCVWTLALKMSWSNKH